MPVCLHFTRSADPVAPSRLGNGFACAEWWGSVSAAPHGPAGRDPLRRVHPRRRARAPGPRDLLRVERTEWDAERRSGNVPCSLS